MKQNNRDIASELINSTVKVIAHDGFDKASTRNIAGECGVADAYIYIYFSDKDDLLAKTFQKGDTELAEEVKKYLPILNQPGMANEDRFYFIFNNMWKFLTATPSNCRFYVQYYYSPYYRKYSAEEHLRCWTPIMEQMKNLFRPETDIKVTLRLVLNTILGQAIKAIDGTPAEQEQMKQSSYELIFGMIRNCLAD